MSCVDFGAGVANEPEPVHQKLMQKTINNLHVRLSDEENRKLDEIMAARLHEGLRNRTKLVQAMIEEEHQRCVRSQSKAVRARKTKEA